MIKMTTHPIAPVYDGHSRILILGSFPSVKSREIGFYYGHPQNRFWRVLSALTDEEIPADSSGKTAFLKRHGIALWDVIGACKIVGSSDASITDVQPNDLSALFRVSPIEAVFCNGSTAGALYKQYQQKQTGLAAVTLPSTSPANARNTLPMLCAAWRDAIGDFLI